MLGRDAFVVCVTSCHHVSIGKDRGRLLSFCECFGQLLNVEGFCRYFMLTVKVFPGFYLVEDLENQDSQENIFRRVSVKVLVYDVSDEILAYSVASTVDIGELVGLQDGVIRKLVCIPVLPPEDIHSLLDEVEVVFESRVVGDDASICHCIL